LDPFLSTKLRRLSVIGMITVVYVHAFNFDDRYLWPGRPFEEAMNLPNFLQVLIANGLFRFGIPLFFLRSGFLIADTEEKYTPLTRVKKRLQTLVVPYLAWSLVGLLLTYLLEISPVTAPFVESSWLRPFNNTPLHQFTWLQWVEGWVVQPISFQLWFLRSLFVYSILYPLLVNGLERFPKSILIFLCLAWLLSFGFVIEGEGLFFFSLGILLRKKEVNLKDLTSLAMRIRLWWWLPALLLLKTWISFQPYIPVPLGYFLHKGIQVPLVLAVWVLYDKTIGLMASVIWLDRLNRYNFFLYGFHVPLLYYATDWVLHLLGRNDYIRGGVYLLLPVIVMGIAFLLGWILRQISEPFFKVFTGGRN